MRRFSVVWKCWMKKEVRKIGSGMIKMEREGERRRGKSSKSQRRKGRGKEAKEKKEKKGRWNEEKELGKMEKIWGAGCVAECLNGSGFREKRRNSQSLEMWEGKKGGKVMADPGI